MGGGATPAEARLVQVDEGASSSIRSCLMPWGCVLWHHLQRSGVRFPFVTLGVPIILSKSSFLFLYFQLLWLQALKLNYVD